MDLTGETAPQFELPRDGGGTLSLADAGRTLVLYFYPKDDTSGCTKQALAFTEAADDFARSGAQVWGVSKDPVKAHDKFRDKHGLSIPLLSDEAGEVCERYGVWAEKKMYGKTYMGIQRSTFLIHEGRVAREWRNVKVPGHVAEVLEAVRSL